MQPLLGNDTTIVTAVNGIPYRYFYRHGGKRRGLTLESIDSGGGQWRSFVPSAPSAASSIRRPRCEPGVIRHVYGDKFPVGEPSRRTVGARRAFLHAVRGRPGSKRP